MTIQTTIRVNKVPRANTAAAARIIDDERHDLAWPAEGDSATDAAEVLLSGGLRLHGATLEALSSDAPAIDRKKLWDAYLNVGMNGTSLVHHFAPGLDAPVQGFEFLFGAYEAYSAFDERAEGEWVEPTVKTAKALIESIDVLAHLVPQFRPVAEHTKAARLLLKFGESIYSVHTALEPPRP